MDIVSQLWDTCGVALDPDGMLLIAALAESGGVRRAAAKLGIPRSTISRRLAQLEDEAGARLVVRNPRRFALTELGVALAERASTLAAVMSESEDLVRRAKAEPTGTLRVAAAPVLGEDVLPEIVAELVRRHPRLSIDARLSVEYVDLQRGEADIALRASRLDDSSDLFAVRLGTSVTGCYAAPSYLRVHGTPQTPGDLAAHSCILVAARTRWHLRDEVVAVNGRVRVDNFRLARALAARGVGIVWVAQGFVKALVDEGKLVPVLERFWAKTPLFAVHASGPPLPPKIRAFIELAKVAVGRAFPT